VKRALITGIGGQDGSYLAELLLERGYAVAGVVRPGSSAYPNLEPVRDRIELLEADLLDQSSLATAIEAARLVSREGVIDIGGQGGVAYFAHVGGFVFGLALVRVFVRRRPTIPPAIAAGPAAARRGARRGAPSASRPGPGPVRRPRDARPPSR